VIRVLIADDQALVRTGLRMILENAPDMAVVGEAGDGAAAVTAAFDLAPEVVLMDVRMPDLDGVELGRVLRRFAAPPQLVFVSAYDSAAVEAFELNALDYLRKPVGRRRLEEALERISSAIEAAPPETGNGHPRPHSPSPESEMVAAANVRNGSTRLISRSSILYVQSHGDFIRIVTADGRYLIRATLGEVERRWEQFGFVRVHRQYLANLTRAVELRPVLGGTAELTFADGQTIPIARRHVAELGRRLAV
jgi:DNA-binding LytR/AlgR family response regulator